MIIASLHTVDPNSNVDTRDHVYLGEAPMPGDLVSTARGQVVRVIRRTFMDHGKAEKHTGPGSLVDVALTVRLLGPHDG